MRKGIYGDELFTICSQKFEFVVERDYYATGLMITIVESSLFLNLILPSQ